MKNKFVQHAVAFKGLSNGAKNNRSGSAPGGHLAHVGAGATQSADQQLQAALELVQQLESRVSKLEAALSVEPNGDVHLFAPGVLKVEGSGRVEISATQSVKLTDGQGNSITLNSSGVATSAAAKASVSCSTHEISAAKLDVSAATSQYGGVVKCQTLIADTVTGKTYTPGAGNVW